MFAATTVMAVMLGLGLQAPAEAPGPGGPAVGAIAQLDEIGRREPAGASLHEMSREAQIPSAAQPAPQKAGHVRDSLVNGTALGAAIGGATALVVMAQACRNNNCSDVSASLDPRFTLFGAAVGAGIGALVDSLVQQRAPGGIVPQPAAAAAGLAPSGASPFLVMAHAGRGQVSDDEGGLGGGGTLGAGVRIPLGRRTGLQISYDRQQRTRDFEFGRRFTGTEQLLMGRMLWFFRPTEAVRPYIGAGIGLMASRSVSESPTFSLGPGLQLMPGPVERYEVRSRGMAMGFSTGMDARIARHLSLLGDLTIDIEGRHALASTRVTVGAGWRF